MKKIVTNNTARLITLNAGTLKTGVTRVRIAPGATVQLTEEKEVDMIENDPWVQEIIKNGNLKVVDPEEEAVEKQVKADLAAKKKAAAAKKKADAAAKQKAAEEAAAKKAPPPPPPKGK